MRMITYAEALRETLFQEMERDDRVFVYGLGAPDHAGIFGTTKGLVERFGPERCLDTPIAEDSMTGMGLGAAINGLRPVHVHIRADFLLVAMNQLANMVATYRYGTGGRHGAPLVIRAVVGRGWGQGFQHSKSMHALFAHLPGLKVVLPTTPGDAKGLLAAAIRDEDPVIVMEHRWLYWQTGEVPEEPYALPIGKGIVRRAGKDLTIVSTSWMTVEAIHAAEILARHGIEAEVVDPRAAAPLDTALIAESVERTGRCLIADNDWVFCGLGAEIAAQVTERCFDSLKKPPLRVGFAHSPCPTARHLENAFYPNAETIVRTAEKLLGLQPLDLSGETFYSHEKRFKGPF